MWVVRRVSLMRRGAEEQRSRGGEECLSCRWDRSPTCPTAPVVFIHICRIINVIDIYKHAFCAGDECHVSSPKHGATGCILS
jgi:hypothetical protein